MSAYIGTYGGDQVFMMVSLQRLENNTWVPVKSWTQKNNGPIGNWEKQWYVAKGYEYRLLTHFYAYKGSSQENALAAL